MGGRGISIRRSSDAPVPDLLLIRSVIVFHMNRIMRMTALMPLSIWIATMATVIPNQCVCRTMSSNRAG